MSSNKSPMGREYLAGLYKILKCSKSYSELFRRPVNKITIHRVVSLMVRILGSNPRGVGSIPTRRAIFGESNL